MPRQSETGNVKKLCACGRPKWAACGTRLTAVLIGLAAASLPPRALAAWQEETLHDRVRRNGSFENLILVEYQLATMADLVRAADAVVRVQVQGYQSRLSRDQTGIETDYNAQVLEVLAGKAPPIGSVVTVTRPGGRLVLDGHAVVATETDFPPFVVGGEYVLFLTKASGERLRIRFGGQGAFEIDGDTAKQMSRAFSAWQEKTANGKPVPLGALLESIQSALRTRRRVTDGRTETARQGLVDPLLPRRPALRGIGA